MALNPIVFSNDVFSAYTEFLINFINFQDRELEKQLKELIKFDLIKGSILVKGPYISLNKPYKIGKTLEELSKEYKIHEYLKYNIKFNLYAHQEEAFRKISEDKNVVISAGTGSGKTESFLLPVLNRLMIDRKEGLRVIIIYPMNALVNDQMLRIKKLFSGTGITFGKYTGETPQRVSGVRKYDRPTIISESDEELIIKGELYPFEEKVSREEIRKDPPNVLITNYSQLEYLLLRKEDLKIFQNMNLEYIILDEIHTYIGEQGSEVAALLRRIKAVSENPEKIKFIGTSATIASGSEEEKIRKITNFAKRLFGVDEVESVFEKYGKEIDISGELYMPLIKDDPKSILNDLLENKLTDDVYYRLTGRDDVDFKNDVLRNSVFRWIIDFFKSPMSLGEAISNFKEKFNRKDYSNEEIASEIYSYLLLGIEVKNEDGYPLIRPRMHFFVKGVDNLHVFFENGKRHIVLGNEVKKERVNHINYPIYVCRNCGQHYFKGDFQKQTLNIGGVIVKMPISEESENEEKEEILFTDNDEYFLDESEANYEIAYLCEKCGNLHFSKANSCVNCGTENLVKVFVLKDKKKCLSCDNLLVSEKSRNLVASTSHEPLDITILTENILSLADNPKILIFTDNRQEASFLRGYMEVSSKRFIYRDRLYKFFKKYSDIFTLSELADKFFEYLYHNGDIRGLNVNNLMSEKVKDSEQYNSVEWFIYEEFCSQISQIRKNSLEKLGLLNVNYAIFNNTDDFLIKWSKELNVDIQTIKGFTFKVLDHLRRNNTVDLRILKLISGRRSNYYKSKLNLPEYISIRGISLYSRDNNLPFIASNKRTYVQVLMKKEFGAINEEFIKELYSYLKKNLFKESSMNGNSYVLMDPEKIIVELNTDKKFLVCQTCNETTALNRKTTNNSCSRYKCKSNFQESGIIFNYDIKRYLNENQRFELKPMEHTGQTKKEEREAAERKFKEGDINVIVATSTLELGIDIGDLDFVLLRNVPPTPANYEQRVGRAGRRLKIGIAITYCGNTSHDQRFFENPAELIKGEIKEPIFSMNNEPLFRRHIHSVIFTTLMLKSNEEDFELLKKAIPNKIADYLFEGSESNPNEDLVKYYRELINSKKKILTEELNRYFSFWGNNIETFRTAYDVNENSALAEKLIENSVIELERILKYTKDLYLYWHKKSEEYHRERKSYNPYNEMINKFFEGSDEYYTLNYLRNHGFLPGYNLVQPGVTVFQIPEVEFFRPYTIALREVAPFSEVYVNGKQYSIKNYAIFSSKEKDFIKKFDIHTPDRLEELYAMHITDVELTNGEKIKSNSIGRKIVLYDIVVDFNKNKGHIGGSKHEMTSGISVEFYRNAVFYLINTGKLEKDKKRHFYICPECGYIANRNEDEKSKEAFIKHIKERHKNFGNAFKNNDFSLLEENGISLYSKHKSDILLIGGFDRKDEAISLGEAIKLGASLVTDITKTDVSLAIEYKNGVYNIILYEDIPGGSGYIEFIFKELENIIEKSIEYLKKCSCKIACYKCLLSFWNQQWHKYIDKNKAIEILNEMKIERKNLPIPPAIEKDDDEKELFESEFEESFFNYLKENGFPLPEQQYEITKPVYTRIDFAYPDKKIAIYVDGLKYHSEFNDVKRDKKITLKLKLDGWTVLRINSEEWEDEDLRVLFLENLRESLEK